jgi:hypothetical protein
MTNTRIATNATDWLIFQLIIVTNAEFVMFCMSITVAFWENALQKKI